MAACRWSSLSSLWLIIYLAFATDVNLANDDTEQPQLPNELVVHCAKFVSDWNTLLSFNAVSRSVCHELHCTPIWRFATQLREVFRYSTQPVKVDSIRALRHHLDAEPHQRFLLADFVTPERVLALLDRLEVTVESRRTLRKILGELAQLAPVKQVVHPDFVKHYFKTCDNVKFCGLGFTLWDLVEDQHDFEPLRSAFPANLVDFIIEVQKQHAQEESPLDKFLDFHNFLDVSIQMSPYCPNIIDDDLVRRLFVSSAVRTRFADPVLLRILLRIGVRFRISEIIQITQDPDAIRTCWPYLHHYHRSQWIRKHIRNHLVNDRITDLLKTLLFHHEPHDVMVPRSLHQLCQNEPHFHEVMRFAVFPNLVNESIDADDRTMLQCAVLAGAENIVRFLLAVPKIDLRRRDMAGRTALDYAAVGSSTHQLMAAAISQDTFPHPH